MNKFLILGLIGLAILSASVLTAGTGAATVGVPGTIFGGNIAKAQDGYRFARIGRIQAQVEKFATHQIMGSYTCVAPKGGDSGGCNLHVNPTVVECQGIAANGGACLLRPHQAARQPNQTLRQ